MRQTMLLHHLNTKNFPLVGYEFHKFSEDDIEVLKNDWEAVRNLCAEITSHYPRIDRCTATYV